MSNLTTQAEYARQRGISRQRVNQLVSEGVVKLVKGLVDPLQADAAIAMSRDPTHGGKRTVDPVPSMSLITARTLKEEALASLRRMESEEKKGNLINKDELTFALKDLFLVIRGRLLGLPAKVSGQIIHITQSNSTNPAVARVEVEKLLKADIYEPLKEIASWEPKQKGGD